MTSIVLEKSVPDDKILFRGEIDMCDFIAADFHEVERRLLTETMKNTASMSDILMALELVARQIEDMKRKRAARAA